MALQLAKTLPTGVSGNYFRVVQMALNSRTGGLFVTVALYLSQAAREAGNQPIETYNYDLSAQAPVSLALTGQTPGDAIYTALKALPDFSGAIDC